MAMTRGSRILDGRARRTLGRMGADRSLLAVAVVVALVAQVACAGARRPAPGSPGLASAAAATAPVAACASAEHRQLDFWIGDWDLVVKARTAPDQDTWTEARGQQHIEAILGGCAVAEDFHADGPGVPWAGRSYSSYQPTLGRWRQTWVDDSGGYLAFTGGMEGGVMTLYGEVQERRAGPAQMRMVFLEVSATGLRWEWQRTVDGGATWSPMMIIDYRRRAAG